MNDGIGTQLLHDMFTSVVAADKQGQHHYLSVVLNFARHCAEDVAGIMPRKQRLLLTKYEIQPPKSEVSSYVHNYVAALCGN